MKLLYRSRLHLINTWKYKYSGSLEHKEFSTSDFRDELKNLRNEVVKNQYSHQNENNPSPQSLDTPGHVQPLGVTQSFYVNPPAGKSKIVERERQKDLYQDWQWDRSQIKKPENSYIRPDQSLAELRPGWSYNLMQPSFQRGQFPQAVSPIGIRPQVKTNTPQKLNIQPRRSFNIPEVLDPVREINPHFIDLKEGALVHLNKNVTGRDLREILGENKKVFLRRAWGENILIQWGPVNTGNGMGYVDVTGKLIQVSDKDALISTEHITASGPEFTGKLDPQKEYYYLDQKNRLLAQKTPDLTDVAVHPESLIMLDQFPKKFQPGFMRLVKNMSVKGIVLTRNNPVCIQDLKSHESAVYFPELGTVETFKSLWSSKGVGNISDHINGKVIESRKDKARRTALGSFQVGTIIHRGRGNGAKFSGKGKSSVLGTNIEKIGLEIIEKEYTLSRNPGDKIHQVHNLKTSMGNRNSYSQVIDRFDSGRGTSDHGVSDDRMKNFSNLSKGSDGCGGYDQDDILRIAEYYLRARNKGFQSFIEVQYDGNYQRKI